MADEMQEQVVNGANQPALRKPPSAWKVGLVYTLAGGPLAGIAGGLIQRHKNKTWLQDEAETRAEREDDLATIRSEYDIGDEDEKRMLKLAHSAVISGYERLALGDSSGKEMIANGMATVKELIGGDIQQRKQEVAKAHDAQRDLITTAAKGLRQENQDTINAWNAIDHSAQKVLALAADPEFDPNKPANKAVLMELLSMGGAMFKDSPDMMDGLAQGVGAFSNMAGGLAQGVATMFKSKEFQMKPEDYNRLALNAQKYGKIFAERKIGQGIEQANSIGDWAKKQGVIPADYSLGEYVTGGQKELKLTPNPVFTGGFESKQEPSRGTPTATLPGTRGHGASGSWDEQKRPTN